MQRHPLFIKAHERKPAFLCEEQLYNLREDIGEQRNLASEYPEKVKELKGLLEKEKEKGVC